MSRKSDPLSPLVLHADKIVSDKHQLHRVRIVPAAPPWARVAFLHGYGDHAGRYSHFLHWLAEQGVAASAVDFRGHGHSTGKRMFVGRWREFLDDLTAFLTAEEGQSPGSSLPLFVIGHSHGGLVAAAAGIHGLLPCQGCVMTAPYLDLKLAVPFHKKLLANVASRFTPALAIKSGIRSDMLTNDPKMVEATKSDPFCLGIATPRWFTTTRRTQMEVRSRAREFTLPTLILVAGQDTVADSNAAIEFYERAGSSDKQMKLYENKKHEILRDNGREEVFGDILNWMRTRVR